MLPASNVPLKPLKWYKKLATRKGRNEACAFLVEGERAITQIAQMHPDEISEVILMEGHSFAFGDHPVRTLTEKQFREICLTETPQGTLAVVRLPAETHADNLPKNPGERILLLEDIQDPGNVGTLIRTAAAFDFDGVIMTQKCADPFSPKCVQATAGTVLSVWLRRSVDYLELVQYLKRKDFALTIADVHGTDEPSVPASQNKLVIALGNEASGPSRELLQLADSQLRIPIAREKAESLNVAACGAICMYLSSLKD